MYALHERVPTPAHLSSSFFLSFRRVAECTGASLSCNVPGNSHPDAMKRTIEAEMEEFRTLQLEEKKVFLANLEGMERSLKEKEKDSAEVCGAHGGKQSR